MSALVRVQPPEIFSTARLDARPPRIADAERVFSTYAQDPDVTRHLSWRRHPDIGATRDFLGACETAWTRNEGHLAWLLFERQTGALVGSIGVSVGGSQACFGYLLARAHWTRGYAAEALKALVDWSLSQPQIYRAWAYCDAANPASARVMEKAGMTREGLLRRWHVAPNLGEEPRDCIVCAKVK
jgi:ribosomal-protein-alanine N-acetyltransferase